MNFLEFSGFIARLVVRLELIVCHYVPAVNKGGVTQLALHFVITWSCTGVTV